MKKSTGNYRRNGKKVYIKQPTYEELAFVSRLWSDEETMKDIGGVFSFPENKWEMFYKKMVSPTDGKNFYCLVYTIRDKAIGEVSFHGYDSVTKIARFNIKIKSQYRNKGYAQEAIKLLLEYYFLEFGGEVIMDNIPTEAGIRVAKKIGFEEVRSNKDEITVKITKGEFLNSNKGKIKNISIMMYNGMDLSSYSIVHDTLKLANKINEKDIFKINIISFEDKITTSNGVKIIPGVKIIEDKVDVIILPNAINIEEQVRDKEKIRYIMTYFNNSDYICADGNAIKFLIRCRALEGIFIPKLQVENLDNNITFKNMCMAKNYIDNGKIMLSANAMGQLELILSLIEKVGGKILSNRVSESMGVERI